MKLKCILYWRSLVYTLLGIYKCNAMQLGPCCCLLTDKWEAFSWREISLLPGPAFEPVLRPHAHTPSWPSAPPHCLCLHAAAKPIPMMTPATIVTPSIGILAQAARIAAFHLVCWNQNQSCGLRILLGDMPQQKAPIFHREGRSSPLPP